MRQNDLIYLILFSIFFYSCKNESQNNGQNSNESESKKVDEVRIDLPPKTPLNKFKKTDFALTLENSFSENKNIIYAPAFLFAWDKVKKELKNPISDIGTSNDFKLLNQSNSFKKSLKEDEYEAKVEIVGDAILAYAYFNKTLPFENKLQVFDDPIIFNKTKVKAFGMRYNDWEIVSVTQILYYKDDNNFILKLSPKDKQQEIILVKGLSNVKNLSEALNQSKKLIDLGIQEKSNSKLSWKYSIAEDDIFSIPQIKFNIETHYKTLEGQVFRVNDKNHHVETAYQRTAFVLNESGAVIESEAVVAVDSAGAESIITHPKKMVFDKTFYIIAKQVKETNPYFVMKVNNSELMIKQ